MKCGFLNKINQSAKKIELGGIIIKGELGIASDLLLLGR